VAQAAHDGVLTPFDGMAPGRYSIDRNASLSKR